MPKILIKETDLTTPGSANNYSNYSVLIPGFYSRTPLSTDEVQPDTNGVYEFSSASAFEQTLGLVRPKLSVYYTRVVAKLDADGKEIKDDDDNVITEEKKIACTIEHFGNQMAYELLNAGYSVIYVPLAQVVKTKVNSDGSIESDSTSVAAIQAALTRLAKEEFWSMFKDKAGYDFRFITHGLLTSSSDIPAVYDDIRETLKALYAAKDFLDGIKENIDAAVSRDEYTKNIEEAYSSKVNELLNKRLSDTLSPSEELILEGISYPITDEDGVPTGDTLPYPTFCGKEQSGTSITELGAYNVVVGEITAQELNIKAYEQNYITPAYINKVNGCIANLALYKAPEKPNETPGRGDCTALIELCENEYTTDAITTLPSTIATYKAEALIVNAINKMTQINADNGKFCALTVPSVIYKMDTSENNPFGGNAKFPGAFHYLVCFMNSLKLGFAEWYAAAGYSRGISNFVIDHTTVKLGEIAINCLEPRNFDPEYQPEYPKFACNVIANFRGGYYLWGNRTAHPLGPVGDLKTGDLVASHFLNIRQLCTTIKKQLYVSCRRFTFDPNSDTLWINFVNAIRPTLDRMKADQGIKDFKIFKVATDKKATLKAKIRIVPIEAVEDFDLEISLEDSFGETTATTIE